MNPTPPPWSWTSLIPNTTATIQLIIITAFMVAFVNTPSDETMKGALIAAFSAAWGYSLGSSKGAAENRDTLNRIAEKP